MANLCGHAKPYNPTPNNLNGFPPPNCADGGDEMQDGPTLALSFPNAGPMGMGFNCGGGMYNSGRQCRSMHPCGVNMGFADGSVHFIKNSIAQRIWYALLVKRDGTILSAGTERIPFDDLRDRAGLDSRRDRLCSRYLPLPAALMESVVRPSRLLTGVWVTGQLTKAGAKYEPPTGQFVYVTFVALEGKDASAKALSGGEAFMAGVDPATGSFSVPGRQRQGIPPGKYRLAVTQKMTREAFDAANPQPKKGAKRVDRATATLGDQFGLDKSPIVREVRGSEAVTMVELAVSAVIPAVRDSDPRARVMSAGILSTFKPAPKVPPVFGAPCTGPDSADRPPSVICRAIRVRMAVPGRDARIRLEPVVHTRAGRSYGAQTA
jgi:prepilin-type processing-associated H-X9-DG protein